MWGVSGRLSRGVSRWVSRDDARGRQHGAASWRRRGVASLLSRGVARRKHKKGPPERDYPLSSEPCACRYSVRLAVVPTPLSSSAVVPPLSKPHGSGSKAGLPPCHASRHAYPASTWCKAVQRLPCGTCRMSSSLGFHPDDVLPLSLFTTTPTPRLVPNHSRLSYPPPAIRALNLNYHPSSLVHRVSPFQ